jgi:hypothetical protein
MIKINFQEPNTAEWCAWRAECCIEQEAHNEAHEAGEVPKVKEKVYKGSNYNIKSNFYVNLNGPFHGKCAYCESLIAADQPGDIEHFRPKGTVTDADNKPIMVDTPSGPQKHPGYYWLAYDWKNLLPSCEDCNRPSKSKSDEKLIGKWNQFPVKDFRATKPGEEEKEKTFLINPILEDPEKHLEVDETGIIKAKNESEKGQACIDIFGLNVREALLDARKKCYTQAKDSIAILIMSLIKKYTNDISYLEEIQQGKMAYSFAARAALRDSCPVLELIVDAGERLNGQK